MLALALTVCVKAMAADKQASNPEPSMSFALVRSNAPGCEPNCPQWIAAKGQIEASTGKKFERFLKNLGKARFPIVVTSGGGRVDTAMQMGRLIRSLKIDVSVGAVNYSGCAPDDNRCKLPKAKKGVYSGFAFSSGYCNSACPLLVAAGSRRVAGSWAFVGVHQITTFWTQSQVQYKVKYQIKNGRKQIIDKKIVSRKAVGNFSTTKVTPKFRKKLEAYFLDMGVDAKIIDRMLAIPASDIRRLSQIEMLDLGLVTSLDQVELFTSAAVCKMEPAAANCVEAEPALPKFAGPAANIPAKQKVVEIEGAHSMWFVMVVSDAPNCRTICPAWISAEGKIDQGAARRLERFLKNHKGVNLPVVINSVSGDLMEAVALAYSMRRHGMSISVGKTRFSGCQSLSDVCYPQSGQNITFKGSTFTTEAYCDVACSLVLAGGVRRYAGNMAYVGLGETLVASDSAAMENGSVIREHYKHMGVEPSLFEKIMATDRISASVQVNNRNLYRIRKLRLNEMLDAQLVTGSDQVDVFSSPSICLTSPPAPNCVAAVPIN
jgi:hypothetical protein